MENPFKFVLSNNLMKSIYIDSNNIKHKIDAFFFKKEYVQIDHKNFNILKERVAQEGQEVFTKLVKLNEVLEFNSKKFNCWRFRDSCINYGVGDVLIDYWIDKKNLLPIKSEIRKRKSDIWIVSETMLLASILEISGQFLDRMRVWDYKKTF